MPQKVTEERQVTQKVDLFKCSICGKKHASEESALVCEDRCKKEQEKLAKIREREDKIYRAKVEQALKDMPSLSEEEYAKQAIELALLHCPDIIPCLGCGGPRMEGYECPNNDCPGEPDGIDTMELFYDERFDLPADFQVILYPTEKKPEENKQ